MDEIICQIGAHLKRRSPRRAPSLPAALFQTVSLGAPEKKSSGKLDRRAGARAGRQLRRARLFINQFNLLLKSSYLLLLSARPASAVCCLSRRALAISGAPLLSWRASERERAQFNHLISRPKRQLIWLLWRPPELRWPAAAPSVSLAAADLRGR